MRPISSMLLPPKSSISFFKLTKLSSSSTPNSRTPFSSFSTPPNFEQLLENCVANNNLTLGKLIHSKILIKGLEQDSYFATKLINLYSNSKDIPFAETVFNRVSKHNVFLLNAMIRGYATIGLYQKGLNLFYQKREEGLKPDSYTFSCVSKVCGSLGDLQQGRDIHRIAVECGLELDLFVSNSLIAMFGKCGSVIDGVQVFDKICKRDIVSWNSVISSYIENGFCQEAMVKVQELVESGLRPNQFTILSLLSICTSILTVRELHCFVLRNGYESNREIRNSLISMYGKCGRVGEARCVFDTTVRPDNVAWNALISSYAQNGYLEESTRLLHEMKVSGLDADVVTYCGIVSSLAHDKMSNDAIRVFTEMLDLGLKPDVVTLASVLPAISDMENLGYGKEIHGYSYRNRMDLDRRIRNALVFAYTKCSSIEYAARVFADTMDRDVISWSSMIVGYVQNGYFLEALHTFREMVTDQIPPNPIAITSILSACAGISGIRQGKEVQVWAYKNGFEAQNFVGSALIDMYAKCGNIVHSRRVFDLITERDSVIFNSMITGYAAHGLGEMALEIFHRMNEPDQVSFIVALSACNHGGMVDEGIKIFRSMRDFGIIPRAGHYACLVDILGRSGRLEEALKLIKTMPVEATVDVWGALLGACKIHSNLDVGVYSGNQLMDMSCDNPGHYVMLSNIMADCERWEEVEGMRKKMDDRGVKKGAGCSLIEVNKRIYSFLANGKTRHPESVSLFSVLRGLSEQMKNMSCDISSNRPTFTG